MSLIGVVSARPYGAAVIRAALTLRSTGLLPR